MRNSIWKPKLFFVCLHCSLYTFSNREPHVLKEQQIASCTNGSRTYEYVPSTHPSSKLQNCASLWLLDNSVCWLIRTIASMCCLPFYTTLQTSSPLVLVNGTTSPKVLLWVTSSVRLDSCSIDIQWNTKATQQIRKPAPFSPLPHWSHLQAFNDFLTGLPTSSFSHAITYPLHPLVIFLV